MDFKRSKITSCRVYHDRPTKFKRYNKKPLAQLKPGIVQNVYASTLFSRKSGIVRMRILIAPMNDVIVLVAVADEYVQVAVVSLEALIYHQVGHKQHPQYNVLNDCSEYLCSENPPKRLANAIPHPA